MSTFDPAPTRPRAASTSELQALRRHAQTHGASNPPALQRLAHGRADDADAVLAAFAVAFSGHVAWRPHLLRATLAHLPAPHAAALQRRLAQELGTLDADDCTWVQGLGIAPRSVLGIPRSELFTRFAQALGLSSDQLATPPPATARYRTRLLQFLTQATPAGAFGAFAFGVEAADRTTSKLVLRGLLTTGSLQRTALACFELADLANDTNERLLRVALALADTPTTADELHDGVHTALQFREQWLAELGTLL